MKDSPPAGFVDFVVARGSALHRTAVLLTRQEQAAEDLVQIALAKAWQSWSRIDAATRPMSGRSWSTSSRQPGARRRVGTARRRRLAALSAATAAVLVVGGLVATTGSTHRAAPPPAGPGPGPFSLNAGGGGFPAYFDGAKRLMVLDVPMLNQSSRRPSQAHR